MPMVIQRGLRLKTVSYREQKHRPYWDRTHQEAQMETKIRPPVRTYPSSGGVGRRGG